MIRDNLQEMLLEVQRRRTKRPRQASSEKRTAAFPEERSVFVKAQRQSMNLGVHEAGGSMSGSHWKRVQGDTRRGRADCAWQAGRRKVSVFQADRIILHLSGLLHKPPHPSTCSHGATVRMTRLDAVSGRLEVSAWQVMSPLQAAGRKWPQDSKQQGVRNRARSTGGKPEVAEYFPRARNTSFCLQSLSTGRKCCLPLRVEGRVRFSW